jgi:hypothetical protein
MLSSVDKQGKHQTSRTNKHNQSKRESGPGWVGFIWLEGLFPRLSLLCQFEVRLNRKKSIQQGAACTG